MTRFPPVPLDPELNAALLTVLAGQDVARPSPEAIERMRARVPDSDFIESLEGRDVSLEDRVVPGPSDSPDLQVAVLRPTATPACGAAVYSVHGGGMVYGSHYEDVHALADWVEEFGLVAVSVRYRLAPEHPYPAAIEDAYAGLLWLRSAVAELGVDASRILVMGGSSGGGIAASLALLSRDRGGPQAAGLLLLCPMLDDRNDSVSSRQYDHPTPFWNRSFNAFGWAALLGEERGTDAVSPYAAAARATRYDRLPPTFIEVGAAEVFRDEDVAFASALWAAGGQAELHVLGGAFHGFDRVAPHAPASRAAFAWRRSWLRRTLGL